MQFIQQERRTFERLNFTSQVVITHHGHAQKVNCKDVNIEAMSLYLLHNQVALEDEILVRFDEHDAHFPALNVNADVIRIQPLESGFLIALQFVTIY